ncbi:hypothetical protein WE348_23185 (plasmid) [Alteromonas macleodii]|uniref:hypothetical protein n=1 Tax=Alteromonas macleodii TaxID=28108 RepID=UPI0030CDD1B1
MQLDNKIQVQKFVCIGRNFGYPSCCIKDFVIGMDWRTDIDVSPVTGWEETCFIPCVKCRENPKAELIQMISNRRNVVDAFPSSAKGDSTLYDSIKDEVLEIVDECMSVIASFK